MIELVELVKALSHENRLRILNLLRKQTLCVCELRNILDLNQSNASRHLNKLKQVGLINYEKKAQWIYYRLNSEMIADYSFIESLLERELDGIEPFRTDIERLNLYNQSKVDCENLDEATICVWQLKNR